MQFDLQFAEGLVVNEEGNVVTLAEYAAAQAELSSSGNNADDSQTSPPPQFKRGSAQGYLPFARHFVPYVDLESNTMVITPPNGWLEQYLEPIPV